MFNQSRLVIILIAGFGFIGNSPVVQIQTLFTIFDKSVSKILSTAIFLVLVQGGLILQKPTLKFLNQMVYN